MAKAVTRAKTKKKKWYSLIAPKLFNGNEIGEAFVSDPEELIGRHVSINMRELMGRRGQNVNVRFEVSKMKDGKGMTFCRGFEMPESAVSRFIRKGRARVDDSFIIQTKDGVRARVKPLVVTTNNTPKSVQTRIRNTTKQELQKYFSKNEWNKVLDEIFKNNIQKRMRDKLSKIYPVRNFEIRILKMVDGEGQLEVDEPEAEEPAEETEGGEEESPEESSEEETKDAEESEEADEEKDSE